MFMFLLSSVLYLAGSGCIKLNYFSTTDHTIKHLVLYIRF